MELLRVVWRTAGIRLRVSSEVVVATERFQYAILCASTYTAMQRIYNYE